ncbi:MAG: MaoC family dehydratase [Rhodoblastus sp.]
MPEFFYEDFVPGDVADFHGDRAITKEEIIRFAAAYDPQPFHLDEEAAKRSMLGGLCASGWHTCCLMMRLNYDTWISRTASLGAPGIDEVRWAKPLRPGDRLTLRRKILNKRVSRNRPEMGLVAMEIDALNQAGEVILRQRHTQMVSPRDPERAAAESAASAPVQSSAQSSTKAPDAAIARVAAREGQKPFAGYLEDLQVGAYNELGSETFTRENIVAFASQFDPQSFHLDEELAKTTHFGGLAASGWQTACLWMRSAMARRAAVQAQARAEGIETPEGGPSPGFLNLRWPKPVMLGDTVTYTTQIIDKRATSKPGWGLAFHHNTGVNQRGERVFEFRGSGFVRMRGA